LPCTEESHSNDNKIDSIGSVSGTGLILFVDDESVLRLTGKQILENNGYDVLVANNGLEAVEIFSKQHKEIDLVIMDMTMPKMNGKEAIIKMKEIDNNCKVIITSGYTKDEQINALDISGFIHKPYSESKLGQIISQVLKSN